MQNDSSTPRKAGHAEELQSKGEFHWSLPGSAQTLAIDGEHICICAQASENQPPGDTYIP